MQATDPKTRLWTRDEYHQMADLGWFEGQRAELVEGEVVVLSPQKFEHNATTDRISELLKRLLGGEFWVRMQSPLRFGDFSEPEPDVSVVAGCRSDYKEHPTFASLIVEVSDTSLLYDRGKKMHLYARIGVPEYWIVNLQRGEVEVRTEPLSGLAGEEPRYRQLKVYRQGERIELSLRAGSSVRVEELLQDSNEPSK